MNSHKPNHTRRQAAKACGISMRQLDRYVTEGLVTGDIVFVEGSGHMRLFTAAEIERLRGVHAARLARQPQALRRYHHGPEGAITGETATEKTS